MLIANELACIHRLIFPARDLRVLGSELARVTKRNAFDWPSSVDLSPAGVEAKNGVLVQPRITICVSQNDRIAHSPLSSATGPRFSAAMASAMITAVSAATCRS